MKQGLWLLPLWLLLLDTCLAQSVSFRYFYYDSGELFRALDSTGTLVEYLVDPTGNITQTNRSTTSTSAPAILSLAPFTAGTGSSIIVYGQNFSTNIAGDVVMINGVAATVISATANQLVVEVPSGVITAGQVTVTVNGITVTSGPTVIFTPLPMPTITSLSPDGVLGGQSATVTVTGTNLTGATFSFPANGPSFTASNITATSATLQITTTAGVRGAYPLIASLADGFSTPATLTPSNSFTIWLAADEADSALVSVANPGGIFTDPTGTGGDGSGEIARIAAAQRDAENVKRRMAGARAATGIVNNSVEAPLIVSGFNSGSTGSDGALNFTTPGVYDFDPVALGLNPNGDNHFNFTTIYIAAGVTINMRASRLREKPVVFLASGAVDIEGTLSVNGQPGYPSEDLALRAPAEPGPGGYPGGVTTSTLPLPQEIGGGPGGSFWCGAFATSTCVQSGYDTVYGNSALDPLRGGSGGGAAGGGGGAGAGAIQIVSSTSITVNGSITAIGGSVTPTMFSGSTTVFYGGSQGSGGAIHLQAPTVSGTGSVSALGGTGGAFSGYSSGTVDPGWIRIDANSNSLTPATSPYTIGSLPATVDLPSGVGTVTVTSVGGISAPAVPQGSFTTPDITINSGIAVPITVAATNMPVGTVVTLIILAQDFPDQFSDPDFYDQVVQTTPLVGTTASSTASASVILRGGVTQISARAVW